MCHNNVVSDLLMILNLKLGEYVHNQNLGV